ncbi:MAG: hypothetical protein HC837_19645 [Chloroflexaceae bacterium]|nr:hypothetical protein [Chloroflexaceae bacterium]
MLIEMMIAGGAAYTGVYTYRQRKQPCLGELLANSQPRQPREDKALLSNPSRRWYHRLPILGDMRRQQIAQLATDSEQEADREATKEERAVDRYIAVSLACLAVTSGGFIYPSLALLCIPGMLYTSVYFVRNGIRDIIYERKITMSLIDLIIVPGIFLTGQFFAVSVACTLFFPAANCCFKPNTTHTRTSSVSLANSPARSGCW